MDEQRIRDRWVPPSSRNRRVGRAYFGLQAAAGAAWWIAVFATPSVREATLGSIDPVLMAFADLPLFVGTSILAAAAANCLVVVGPYRYIRNPMAVAGIAQAAAIGCAIGSWLVVAYGLAGIIYWNELVRPFEEADLAKRFGDAYEKYRARVRCWVPRLHAPTSAASAAAS